MDGPGLADRSPVAVRAGRRPAAVLAVVLLAASALILWAGRGITLIGDEWSWVTTGTQVTAGALLDEYNGHLNALTEATYIVLPRTAGLADYAAYRVVALVLHLVVALLVYALARPRVGAWPAVAAAGLIAVLGTGADAFLHAIEVGILGASAACLAALWNLDRGTRRNDLAACGLLIAGLASFSSAVAFTAGVWAEVLARPDRRRRIWVPAVPTALYLAWRLHWGGSLSGESNGSSGGVLHVIAHAWEAASGAVGGLAGLQIFSPTLRAHVPWAGGLTQVLSGVAAVLLAWVVVRRGRLTPRLANLVVAALLLWGLTAVARGSLGDLAASRYVYQGAVIVVLIVVEALAGLSAPRRVMAAAALAVVVSAGLNLAWMVVWGNHLRDESTTARAQLAALDIAGPRTPPTFRPSATFALSTITARSYFDDVRRFGSSPAYGTAELRRAPEPTREAADGVLARATGLRVTPGRAPATGSPPEIEGPPFGRVVQRGSCLAMDRGVVGLRAQGRRSLLLRAEPGGALLVRARRFGTAYTVGAGGVGEGSATLTTSHDPGPGAWHVQVISTGPARVCSTGRT
jgi:hypothetical protein